MKLSISIVIPLLLACFLSAILTPTNARRTSFTCRAVCYRHQSLAKDDCTRSRFIRNRCRVTRCSLHKGYSGWICRRRTFTPRPSNDPEPSPVSIARGCRNRCYGARLSAFRDCRFRSRPVLGCSVVRCRHPRKLEKFGWKCAPVASPSSTVSPTPLPFDINGDGILDNDDLILVLRAILDPLGEVSPNDPVADLNDDGVVDFDDAKEMLSVLIESNGAASVAPLTSTYNEEHNFNWDQTPLNSPVSRALPATTVRQDFLGVANRQAATCGAMAFGDYKKGSGPDPTIVWDDGFPFNSSAKATAADHWNWVGYGILVSGARFTLPDGARAYRRYIDRSGADLTVDYEKAIRDDSLIRSAVNAELQAVKNAVREMHDGNQASFSFHSTDARLVNAATENWQKAVGGHRIWSKGSVTYSASSCELQVAITIMVEDFYNFNKGQFDIATGLPDNDKGRFEVLGWAKSFFSRGEITRTETIPLQCCDDSDCGDATQFDCECNLCTAQCPTQQRSGGQGFTSFTVDLKKSMGTFQVSYQMFTVPDELTILYGGQTVFSTGGLVSGSQNLQVTYGSATSTSTVVTVELNAPRSGTRWEVSISCPP